MQTKKTNRPFNQIGSLHLAAVVAVLIIIGIGFIGYRVFNFSHAATLSGPVINANGRCLDNYLAVAANRNKIDLYTCNNSAAQQWQYIDNTLRIGSYCLDIPGASKAPQTVVQLYQCNGTVAQKWLRYTDNTIRNPNSGLCLDNKSNINANLNPIWIYACNGTVAQKWTIKAVTTPVSTPPPAPTPTPPAPVPTPIPAPVPAPAPADTNLLTVNFNDWTAGAISTAKWNSSMGGGGGTANLEDSSIVTRNGTDKALRTFLQANTIRSTPAGNNGTAMVVPLKKTVDEATIQYQIKFDGSFDWGWGGKLPGLAGIRPGSPLSLASGGNYPGDNGWSGRIMWDTPGSYPGSAQSPNEGLLYMYGKAQADRYGDNLWWNKSFSANTWQTVKVHYKLNTPGRSDGILQAWLDGAPMVNRSDWLYRSTSEVRINYIYFDIFRGGATLDWAGKVNSNIDFDNLTITTP